MRRKQIANAMLLWLCCSAPRGSLSDAQPADASSDIGAATGDAATGCSSHDDCLTRTCLQGDLELACRACVNNECVLCDDAADCHVAAARWNACQAGQCMECVTSADCATNPSALGSSCDVSLGFCICANEGECENNPNGRRCLEKVSSYCGCETSADCGEIGKCETRGGLDTCVAPSSDEGTP